MKQQIDGLKQQLAFQQELTREATERSLLSKEEVHHLRVELHDEENAFRTRIRVQYAKKEAGLRSNFLTLANVTEMLGKVGEHEAPLFDEHDGCRESI